MEKETIKISKSEYEGMKETIELLQDPDMINQVIESEKNIEKGNVEKLSLED